MVKLFYSKKRIRKLFRKNFETESSLHQRLNQSLMLILLMTLRIGKKFIACHNVCLGDKDSRISVQITKQMPCDKYFLMQNWYYTISNVLLMWWIGWITLAQLFLSCQVLGSEVIKWLVDHKFKIENLSGKDILFDIIECGDEIIVNRILLLAKKYLYSCRHYSTSIRVLNSKIDTFFLIEAMIAKSTNKLETHNMKWSKYKSD